MLRESENYAYLADPAVAATNISDSQVFAQKTRLMPEGTRPNFSDPNAKTAVLPVNISQETAVRNTNSEARTNLVAAPLTSVPLTKGRGLGVAAGALMMLLVGVVIAGGIYLVKPSIFAGSGTEKTGDPIANIPVTADSSISSNPSIPANSVAAKPGFAEGETNSAKSSTDDMRPLAPEKPVETTKNTTKTTGSSKPKTDEKDGAVMDINVDDMDLPAGGIVVRDRDENGKPVTIRVNPTGPPDIQRPPNGRHQNPVLPPDFDMRNLTPAQRQKLQRVLRNNPQFRPPTPPNRDKP